MTIAGVALALLSAPAAAPAQEPDPPYVAYWNGANPFNCTIQDVGTGTVFPDPNADPFCVEFDKTQQNVTDLGIADFLANEPARAAAASPKCFYYQVDHWTGSIVQGEEPELWHWDGAYFFDKAFGAGGVHVENFTVLGQPADLPPGTLPPSIAQYAHGGYVVTGIPVDPACAARVDTPEEASQVYAGGQPPLVPGGDPSGGSPYGGTASGGAAAGATGAKTAKKKCKRRKGGHGKRRACRKQSRH